MGDDSIGVMMVDEGVGDDVIDSPVVARAGATGLGQCTEAGVGSEGGGGGGVGAGAEGGEGEGGAASQHPHEGDLLGDLI